MEKVPVIHGDFDQNYFNFFSKKEKNNKQEDLDRKKLGTLALMAIAVVSFIITLGLSISVMLHSYYYLEKVWTGYKSVVIVPVIVLIESVYIFIPYLTIGAYDKLTKGLIGFFFFLSVIPATLETTKKFGELFSSDIYTMMEPIVPTKSELITTLHGQLKPIDEQIKRNNIQANVYLEKRIITYGSKVLEKQNAKLTEQKLSLLNRIAKLELDFNEEVKQWKIDMQKYGSVQKQKTAKSIFEWGLLFWSVFFVVGFQVANAKLVHTGSKALRSYFEAKTREENINKVNKVVEEEVIEEVEEVKEVKEVKEVEEVKEVKPIKRNIDVKKLFLEHSKSQRGIGERKIETFLERYNISDTKSLKDFFIRNNFRKLISNDFTGKEVEGLIKTCADVEKTIKFI